MTKSRIILIGNKELVKKQMKKLKHSFYLNEIFEIKEALKKKINIINIQYKFKKIFSKINSSSNHYIENCFDKAIRLIKNNNRIKLINGPISKKNFLGKKHLGITEFIAQKFKSKKSCMLIYNKKLSVSPLTTHLPLRSVYKRINKSSIIEKVKLINEFYRKQLKITLINL